jgi:hypothetical protein
MACQLDLHICHDFTGELCPVGCYVAQSLMTLNICDNVVSEVCLVGDVSLPSG